MVRDTEKIEKVDAARELEPRSLDSVVRDHDAEKSSLERQGETNALSEINEIKARYAQEAIIYAVEVLNVSPDEMKELPSEIEERMNDEIAAKEMEYTVDGVCFAYCQMGEIVKAYKAGQRVEIEGFGPYLRDYFDKVFADDGSKFVLTKSDEIGMRIMLALLDEMPDAHVVSLFDEYNFWIAAASKSTGKPENPSDQITIDSPIYERGRLENESQVLRNEFRKWVEGALRSSGAIEEGQIEGPEADYVLVSETDKINDAKRLVIQLEKQGYIEGNIESETGEIWFQNTLGNCEDARYMRIRLRDAEGHWECAALDSSGYFDNPEEERAEKNRNSNITSLIILPGNPMQNKKRGKEEDANAMVQRAKVWEILHALRDENGQPIFHSKQVQDMFYNEEEEPDIAANAAAEQFRRVA